MPVKLNRFQTELLIYFADADPKRRTVSDAARFFSKPKSTVVYTLAAMRGLGLVQHAAGRKSALTVTGIKVAEQYKSRLSSLKKYMIYQDISPEEADENAMLALISGFSDEFLKRIDEQAVRMTLKEAFSGRSSFDGRELCSNLKEGRHSFPFVLFRENAKNGDNISMGNNGFEHPSQLIINGESRQVYLKIKTISAKSALSGSLMEGRINRLQYREGGEFYDAGFDGRYVFFPASSLCCTSTGTGRDMMIHCSAYLKIQCSVGEIHMPESKAIFTMFIL